MKFIKVTVIYPKGDQIKYINFNWVLEIIPNSDNTTLLNVKYHYDEIHIRESIEYLKLEIKNRI
jgi:hypothetical protein